MKTFSSPIAVIAVLISAATFAKMVNRSKEV
jgi:hypothetical protein